MVRASRFVPTRQVNEAKEVGVVAAQRVSGRRLQLRRSFTKAESSGHVSPLVRCLRGGRAGGEAVRLKLLLSLLWMSAGEGGGRTALPPHCTDFPLRFWAELLGLEDPGGRGRRRVANALAWLHGNGFVDVVEQPGKPAHIIVLREDGSGEPYTLPGKAYAGMKAEGRYIRILPAFWADGYVAKLSGAAIAVMLILHTTGLEWLAGSVKMEYDLSEDSWTKGTRELRDEKLLVTQSMVIRPTPMDVPKRRYHYELDAGHIFLEE